MLQQILAGLGNRGGVAPGENRGLGPGVVPGQMPGQMPQMPRGPVMPQPMQIPKLPGSDMLVGGRNPTAAAAMGGGAMNPAFLQILRGLGIGPA